MPPTFILSQDQTLQLTACPTRSTAKRQPRRVGNSRKSVDRDDVPRRTPVAHAPGSFGSRRLFPASRVHTNADSQESNNQVAKDPRPPSRTLPRGGLSVICGDKRLRGSQKEYPARRTKIASQEATLLPSDSISKLHHSLTERSVNTPNAGAISLDSAVSKTCSEADAARLPL